MNNKLTVEVLDPKSGVIILRLGGPNFSMSARLCMHDGSAIKFTQKLTEAFQVICAHQAPEIQPMMAPFYEALEQLKGD